MELGLVARLFDDKQIMNPMNPSEVFTCKDLIEGKLTGIKHFCLDYKVCRKEKRLQTAKVGKKQSCAEYRSLGKYNQSLISKIANKCFYMQEDEFVDLVLEKYEKRKKYADYLEKEGSIMAKSFRERESIFRLRNTGANEGPETEH